MGKISQLRLLKKKTDTFPTVTCRVSSDEVAVLCGQGWSDQAKKCDNVNPAGTGKRSGKKKKGAGRT